MHGQSRVVCQRTDCRSNGAFMDRANFCSLSQVNIDVDGNCRDYNPLRNLSQNTKNHDK